jgi:hypothetical protein
VKKNYLRVIIELPTGKYESETVCVLAEDYIDAKIKHRIQMRASGHTGTIVIREISEEEALSK